MALIIREILVIIFSHIVFFVEFDSLQISIKQFYGYVLILFELSNTVNVFHTIGISFATVSLN